MAASHPVRTWKAQAQVCRFAALGGHVIAFSLQKRHTCGEKKIFIQARKIHNFMNRGFINIAIIIALVVIVGGVGWWYLNQSDTSTSETTRLSTQQPTGTQAIQDDTGQASSRSSATETSNLKTYSSESWGMEFKYPSNFVLNTLPSAFWRDFGIYRDGYDFFELVDTQKNCYIGPVKSVGLAGSGLNINSKTISADGRTLEVEYIVDGSGSSVLFGQAGLLTPDVGPWLSLNVTSLSNELIESNYKNTSTDRTVSEDCVEDFETILTSVRFTN